MEEQLAAELSSEAAKADWEAEALQWVEAQIDKLATLEDEELEAKRTAKQAAEEAKQVIARVCCAVCMQ